ncbi:MAG: hypothetical protein EB101_08260, partial [Chitinophagia bacterium]|nr:hypothetical protein [Chitinophagia bacterium]
MALSPADFYSYSRATGAPIPEDPEERARMAPEVLAYRRNQLKAPQQQTEEGFNFNDVLAVGAGLATAGLAALAARRGVRALKETPRPLQPETIARAEQAAKTQDFGAVGNIVRDLSEVPAVAPSKRTQPEGQFTELSVVRQPTTFKAFSERVSPVDISEVPGLAAYKELQEAELYSQTPEAQLEERRATRAVQAAESKEKALGKNVLLELRRELEEEQSAQSEFSPRKYAEQTGALEPVDATSVQTSQQPLVADQQNNAVLSGEDQFTGKDLRALQRDTDVIAGRTSTEDQLNTQEAAAQQFLAKKINSAPDIDLDATYTYQDLKKAGLPDFEIDARIQAYASTGDKLLMNPNVNSKTLGHNEFLKVLGVRNARINDRMQLIEGELVNPEGDVRMSAFARQQPSVSQQLEDVESRPYEPISQGLTGLAGGVGTAPAIFKKDIKLSEQYETSIKNFRSEWDRNVRENAMRAAAGEGDYSDIIMPARAERLVDTDDLDIPVRIETDDEGRVLNRTLYRDILPVETVQRIESGQKTLLDVPFMVNKGRAYLDYKRNPSLANRAVAKDYQRTGRALVGKYQTIVGPYEGSKYIPELQEGRYFEPGETGVTPARGPGSQKGKLVGGVIEEPVTQTLAPLKFIKKSEGGRVFQQAVELGGTNPVNTLDELQQLGDVQDFKGNVLRVSPEQQANFVVTQPMSVRRVTPVTQQLPGGQTAQRMVQRVARKTGKPFSAPLVTIEDV